MLELEILSHLDSGLELMPSLDLERDIDLNSEDGKEIEVVEGWAPVGI